MPTVFSNESKIRQNLPAMNAYNALIAMNNEIATHQLRLSTGKRINSASDDVAGYITSRSLNARNQMLKASQNAVGEAKNVTALTQDALDNISGLLTKIKEMAATAASGALGTDEKVALAKAAYRLTEQIQTVVDATVFGGKQLLDGTFSGEWTIGFKANNALLTMEIDLQNNATAATKFNVAAPFNLIATGTSLSFAGVSGLSLASLNDVSSSNLGIFSYTQVSATLTSIQIALDNVNKVASYLGGIENRLTSQEDLIRSEITNYTAAISRIEDADVAQEQMNLIKAQFLQQTSLISLSQANQNPTAFLQLFR
ncbi:MAG TPA: flagellin [Bacteroidota bacterium]|nr:flagellin [Candidatus Kapabacteria bacterium]HRS01028.1 flagellin [Bacteroidota bacterium]